MIKIWVTYKYSLTKIIRSSWNVRITTFKNTIISMDFIDVGLQNCHFNIVIRKDQRLVLTYFHDYIMCNTCNGRNLKHKNDPTNTKKIWMKNWIHGWVDWWGSGWMKGWMRWSYWLQSMVHTPIGLSSVPLYLFLAFLLHSILCQKNIYK